VSLVVAADQISVGRSPISTPTPDPDAKTKVRLPVWGDPKTPDPRLRIAGWEPSLGAQVAADAEADRA
jgi:hypothetical protein